MKIFTFKYWILRKIAVFAVDLLLLCSTGNLFAQTIVKEYFLTNVSPWTGAGQELTWTTVSCTDIRVSTAPTGITGKSPSGDPVLEFKLGTNGFLTPESAELCYTTIDLSAYSSTGVKIRFYWQTDDVDAGEGLRCAYSTNSTNGVDGTWNLLAEYLDPVDDVWTLAGPFTIPGASCVANFKLRFSAKLDATATENVAVDDIRIFTGCDYCKSTWTNLTVDWIQNVTFNTINKPSGSTPYSDFTTLSTTVVRGNAYTLYVTLKSSYVEHVWAWFDWNQDCDFLDAGEAYDLGQNAYVNEMLSIPITIPATATLGKTTMRIIEQYNANPTSCLSGTYGETEDYTVDILDQSGNMAYYSSNVTQNTDNVALGLPDRQIIGIQVVTSGSTNPISVTSFTVNANGTTTPVANDIENAKIYYTGTTNSFSPVNQFGSTYSSPTTTNFNITGTQQLSTGTNFFWLTYDIKATATVSHVVDAECSSITVGGSPKTPSTTAPSGNRTIIGSWPYCTVCETSGNTGAYIQDVIFESINNTTGSAGATCYYQDYYATQTATVAKEQSYNLTINCVVLSAATYYWALGAWIDFNNDGDWNDAGEKVAEKTVGPSVTALNFFSSVAIPSTATVATSRMRVFLQYITASSGLAYPCVTGANTAEVEDYKVIITAPACVTPGTPVSLTTSGISQTNATFTWAAGSPAGSPAPTYYWAVGLASGVTYESGYTDRGTTTNLTASTAALSCDNTYYWTVKACNSCPTSCSAYPSSISFPTSPCGCTTPGTPTIGTGTATGQFTADLSWSAGSPVGSPTVTYYWEVHLNSTDALVVSGSAGSSPAGATGLTCNTTYHFHVRAYTSCNATYSSWAGPSATFTTNACGMYYVSSSCYQITIPTARGLTDQEVIRIEIVTSNAVNPLSATSFTVNTNGSTNAANDIVSTLKIYYTGTSSTFSTGTLFGSGAAGAITGSQQLSSGTNYFWLAYDITAVAIIGNVVDGECTSFIINSTTTYYPSTPAPSGNRPIGTKWIGETSTDWFTASNWDVGVPSLTIDAVIIAGTTYQPSTELQTDVATCRDIEIKPSATLSITNNAALTKGYLKVYGSLINNGTITQYAGGVSIVYIYLVGNNKIIQGTGAYNGEFSTGYGIILIDNGASYTLQGNLPANNYLHALRINASGTLNLNSYKLTTYQWLQYGIFTTGTGGTLELSSASGGPGPPGGNVTTPANTTWGTNSLFIYGYKDANVSLNYADDFYNVELVPGTGYYYILPQSWDLSGYLKLSAAEFQPASYTINLGGDFINNATFTPGTSTVIFDGSSAQNITGSNATTFNNLTINNSSTGVTQNKPVTVSNIFTLTNGAFNLNSLTATVTNAATTAITRTNGYVVSETNAAVNTSILQWNIGTNTAAHVFPFGVLPFNDVNGYIPVTFQGSGSGPGNISISTRSTGNNNTPLAGASDVAAVGDMYNFSHTDISISSVIDRWWDITSSSGPTIPAATISLSYLGAENTLTSNPTSTLGIQHWTGSSWNNGQGGAANSIITTSTLGSQGTGPHTVNATGGFTQFSPYVLVTLDTPLPIELLGFTASCDNNKVDLNWSTASETNNDYFSIAKSKDLIDWNFVGTIPGSGTTNEMHMYNTTDFSPFHGISYYRLKQVDYDGGYEIFDPVATECIDISENSFEIIGTTFNEAHDQLTVAYNVPEDCKVSIYLVDAIGQKIAAVSKKSEAGLNAATISFRKPLAIGVYMVTIEGNNNIFTQKIFLH